MPSELSVQVERIRERMTALGLNPYSAAKKAGLGESFVRDILRGKVKSPSAERLAKLAEALECSLNYLLGRPEAEFVLEPRFDRDGEVSDSPSPLARPDWDNFRAKPGANLLPIRFELMTSAFRRKAEIERDLGFEVASIPIGHHDRPQWFEVVRDDGASLVAPPGSLLQVAQMTDVDRGSMRDGDVVVVEKHLIGPSAAYYLVERSVRIIRRRYPDLGLWFFEYASDDEEYWGISDDIFRDERSTEQPPEMAVEAVMALIEDMRRSAGDLDPASRDQNEAAFASLLQQRKMRPRLVGKVLRALVPIDPLGGFGLAVQGGSRKIPT